VQDFLHAKMMLFEMRFVLMQEGKLARATFPPCWNDVIRDALVFLHNGKLAHASFPPCWNDVI
jgi:hypothetical protein